MRSLGFITLIAFVLNACSIFVESKYPNGIIIHQPIFVDTTPSQVYLSVDSVLPNLEDAIKNEIQTAGLGISNTKHESPTLVILKVKTIYNGKATEQQIESMIEGRPIKQKNTVDFMLEDPSGMIVGFAIGASMSTPIVTAPVGIAVGGIGNLMAKRFFSAKHFTIFEIEVLEIAKKPIWYKDLRTHKIDETSTRTFDYSEETKWKTHKTRIFVHGRHSSNGIAKRVVSLVL